jgi:hypothetical protein
MPATRRFLVVAADGRLSLDMPVRSYAQGTAGLLTFAAPGAQVEIMEQSAPTRIGFQRTGNALRAAMKLHRDRQPA